MFVLWNLVSAFQESPCLRRLASIQPGTELPKIGRDLGKGWICISFAFSHNSGRTATSSGSGTTSWLTPTGERGCSRWQLHSFSVISVFSLISYLPVDWWNVLVAFWPRFAENATSYLDWFSRNYSCKIVQIPKSDEKRSIRMVRFWPHSPFG